MRFSAKTEYGILAALELALRSDASPLQTRTIAKNQQIPLRFLEQVLSGLRKAGLVESIRGARGGYILGRDPSDIRINDIFEAVEGPMTPAACVLQGEGHHCKHELETGECLLKPIWAEVQSSVVAVLNGLTLQDLCERMRKRDQQKILMYHI